MEESAAEDLKRKPDTEISMISPALTKHVKVEDVQQNAEVQNITPPPTLESCTGSSTTSCDSSRGNITIIHVQSNNKHAGLRMQWTFPRSYLTTRVRSITPQSPCLGEKVDAELNTANLNGLYTPEAIAVFYQAVTTESSVPSNGHSLHEYCQIHALAQYFSVSNIFREGETSLLRRVMGDETSLETIKTASSLASIFRWRALVERCRSLLCRRVRIIEQELRTMNCGSLNILATKFNEIQEAMSKSGLIHSTNLNTVDLRSNNCKS